jgi:hypothetical protein
VLVVDIGYFPRAKAPESALPQGTPPAQVLEYLRHAVKEMDAALERAAVRFGPHARVVRHPYFGGMTVGQWRRFHLRHMRHHMRQVSERTAAHV